RGPGPGRVRPRGVGAALRSGRRPPPPGVASTAAHRPPTSRPPTTRGTRVETFLEQLFNGVSLGSILLLVALGRAFTFGQVGVINMAHGELIMAGAYTPYVLQTGTIGLFAGATGAGLAFVVALPVAFLVAGLIGVVLERVIIRRMYGR